MIKQSKNTSRLTHLFIAAAAFSLAAAAIAQEPVVAAASVPDAIHFDAQYEDSGVKVFITKVFPAYTLKNGQKIFSSHTDATRNTYSAYRDAGFKTVSAWSFADKFYIGYSDAFQGTVRQLNPTAEETKALEDAASSNQVRKFGEAGAGAATAVVVGHALAVQGIGTTPMNAGILATGSGVLITGPLYKSEKFLGGVREVVAVIQPNDGDFLYIVKLKPAINQGESILVLQVPHTLKMAIRSMKTPPYAEGDFQEILARAVAKTVPIKLPADAG